MGRFFVDDAVLNVYLSQVGSSADGLGDSSLICRKKCTHRYNFII